MTRDSNNKRGGITSILPMAPYSSGKRILIQRQCELCKGSGLIQRGKYKRKCTSCGGFLPWESWELFLTDTTPGNGGVVRFPKGQTSVFFDVAAAKEDSIRRAAAYEAAEKEREARGDARLDGNETPASPESTATNETSR